MSEDTPCPDSTLSFEEVSRRRFLLFSSSLLSALLLGGCGGGERGSADRDSAPPPKDENPPPKPDEPVVTMPRSMVRLSAQGPPPQAMRVILGAHGAAALDGEGAFTGSLPADATSTVTVTDSASNTPLLFAVLPPGSSGPVEITPESTVLGLLFYQSAGWLIPQEKHSEFFQRTRSLPVVMEAITRFDAAYQADGLILSKLTSDASLSDAMQRALDETGKAIYESSLNVNIEAALGLMPTTRAWNLTGISDVSLTVSGDSLRAMHNSDLTRWVEITRKDNTVLGRMLLPQNQVASLPLNPDPLPLESPLYAYVTGGLKHFNPETEMDFRHVVPIGLNLLAQVVLPVVSTMIGIKSEIKTSSITSDPSAANFPTDDPFINELFKVVVWNKDDPWASLDNPVPTLLRQITTVLATKQDIRGWEWFSLMRDWIYDELWKALQEEAKALAAAAVVSARNKGFAIGLDATVEALSILAGPIIRGAVVTYKAASLLIDLWLTNVLLTAVSSTDVFVITGQGNAGVVVRSVTGLRRTDSLTPLSAVGAYGR